MIIAIMDGSVYFDYLHYLAPILEKIVDLLCNEKLEIALKTKKLIVGFDGGWAQRRDANQLFGILIDFNDSQPLNAHLPIVPTENGISTCKRELQLLKASLDIHVTKDGITTRLSDEHPLNILEPISDAYKGISI